MNRLYKKYKKEMIPQLKEKLAVKNIFSVPKLEKIVINVGLGQSLNDKEFIEMISNNIAAITGQMPVKTKAKKSISNFKIRKGMPVGLKVTLRDNRMYDFFDKLINVTFPRVRDFRGIDNKIFDGKGNVTIGIKEHSYFPEIKLDEAGRIHGLEISIATTAKNDKDCLALLEMFGFPFKK